MIEQFLIGLVALEAVVCICAYVAGFSAGKNEVISSTKYTELRKQADRAEGYRWTLESISEAPNPKSTTPRDDPRTVARAAIRQAGRS